VAINYELSNGIKLPKDVYYHKGEAIRLINRNIVGTNEIPSDELIGAVAILANCEVSSRSRNFNQVLNN
jgi:hypothetical protein